VDERRQASPVTEEEKSLPRTDLETGFSYSGLSTNDNEGERNLEDEKDATITTEEEESLQLEWWELDEKWYEEEEEEEMLEVQELLLASFAYKREEDRERTEMAGNVITDNDEDASASSLAISLPTDNDDIIDISDDREKI
jgi:hypothetical protein